MPITQSDIKLYESYNGDSEGGMINEAAEITNNVKNNLFPDVSGEESVAGGVHYRKVFTKNEHGSLTWQDVVTWPEAQPSTAAFSYGFGINDSADNDEAQGNMTDFSGVDQVALISDGADTRNATIVGEDQYGVLQSEVVQLYNTNEVLSVNSYSRVYAVHLDSTDGSNTVLVKEGTGGTTRGTIGADKIICWLWFGRVADGASIIDAEGGNVTAKADGIQQDDIPYGDIFGTWLRVSWPTNSAATTPDTAQFSSEGETDA